MQVIDLGLEVLDFLLKLKDGLPNDFGIQLVVVGELRDHPLVGIESTLHHPLALEDWLLHGFKLCLHASGTPWSLHIADVQHPLTHLNGLSVLQHPRKIGVDNPLEKLVLGSAWRRHDALRSETETARNENRGYLRDTVVKTFRSIYNEFLPTKIRNVQENGVRKAHELPTRQGGAPSRGGALHSRGSLVSLSDYFFLPKILK